jgi:ribose 5-phosphate isomerase B
MVHVALGADHRGFAMKELFLKEDRLADEVIVWHDVGSFTPERSDYPLFAAPACKLLLGGKVEAALLLCGTGIGMAMAANRYHGIYAGVVWNEDIARRSREEDGTNVLCLAIDYLTYEEAERCLVVWLSSVFKKGRYEERLRLIDSLAP